jgi:hypothetical protein
MYSIELQKLAKIYNICILSPIPQDYIEVSSSFTPFLSHAKQEGPGLYIRSHNIESEQETKIVSRIIQSRRGM